MTEKEHFFWNKLLELAKEELTQATFDYYVLDTKLIKVQNNVATILLEEVKKLFWEKNMQSFILMAGFEAYNSEIKVEYVFDEALLNEANSTVTNNDFGNKKEQQTPALPTLDSDLNSKYTFDNFIQGDENRWSVAASLAVADSPGATYNPLFIYGGPGLGKTHLLNAIGNKVLHDNPQARIKYITAENFINEFVVHIRLDKMDELKLKYRHLDVLLIDDIQSLAKKSTQATQEEFFNTFNVLHNNNKQIVLTSDRNPDQLNEMEERLVTRFKWGLTVNITPPDFETRVAILTNKIMDYDYHFPPETIEYLAGQFDSNVRELEGAINDITLIARVKKIKDITIDIAAEAIRARKQDARQILVIPIEKIQTEVGNFYGVSVKEMKGTRRVQNIVLARQVAMYLARELTDNSLPKIGKEFGGKDHTTVIHAHAKIKSLIDEDDNLRLEIEAIKKKIK
ncbi:MAG: chromosomal replication initiator protein DnaA [Streptococcus sp.]|nr:chromosomal replication initiator protein DnaA [Streptococcus sp.]